MNDEELLQELERVHDNGFKSKEHIRNIHMEIPEWLYQHWKKNNISHNRIYYLGWIHSIKNNTTHELVQLKERVNIIEKTLEKHKVYKQKNI